MDDIAAMFGVVATVIDVVLCLVCVGYSITWWQKLISVAAIPLFLGGEYLAMNWSVNQYDDDAGLLLFVISLAMFIALVVYGILLDNYAFKLKQKEQSQTPPEQ